MMMYIYWVLPPPCYRLGQFPKYLYVFLVLFGVVAQSDFCSFCLGEDGIHQSWQWPSLPCFSFRFVAFKVPKVSILVLGDILDYPGIPLFSSIPWSLATGHSLRQGNNNGFGHFLVGLDFDFVHEEMFNLHKIFDHPKLSQFKQSESETPDIHVCFLGWQKLVRNPFEQWPKPWLLTVLLYTTQLYIGIQISHEKRSPLNNQHNGMSMSAKMSPY